jgi:hypothetical protein
MRRLIIVLMVLAILFVVVDRVTVRAAEREVGNRMQLAAQLERAPKVRIHGFPFLTQALRGRYRHIEISIDQAARGNVVFHNLDAHLYRVHAPIQTLLSSQGAAASSPRAGVARASAVVPYSVVADLMPGAIDVRNIQANGRHLSLRLVVSAFGRSLPATATGGVSVHGGALVFTPKKVDVETPVGLEPPIPDQLRLTVPANRLPLGLRLSGVRVAKSGLRVSAVGRHLSLAPSL